MKYGNECESKDVACCGGAQASRQESLTEVMISVRDLGCAAMSELQRIRTHLFGDTEPPCEPTSAPVCFRDELEAHRKVLMRLNNELRCIADQLGL